MKIKHINIIYICLAILLGAMFGTGWYLTNTYGSDFFAFSLPALNATWGYIVASFIMAMILFPTFTFVDHLINKYGKGMSFGAQEKFSIKRFLIIFAIIEVVYVLILILSYPGYFVYDGGNQLIQVLYDETPYSAHHPLFHTLLFGWIVKIGYKIYPKDLSFGIFLYNLFQMTLCGLSFSYVIEFIRRTFKNKILYIFSIIYFAIHPTIIIFAMATTKDIICYLGVLLGFVFIYEIIGTLREEKTVKIYKYILALVFLMIAVLTRKNVGYAIVLFALITLIFQKKGRLKITLLMIGSVILGSLINAGLNKAFSAEEASMNEALSIPYQQINRVYIIKGEAAFDSQELEYLYSICDKDNLFAHDPTMADYSKTTFGFYYDDVISKDKVRFFKFWAKKGIENPGTYIEAFLYTTYQGWYPFTINKDCKGPRYYDITGFNEEWGTEYHGGKYNFMYRLIEGIRFCEYSKIPVVRLIFQTGSYFALFLLGLAICLANKKKEESMVLLLILSIIATNLMGPVADVRYYLILFYLCPLILGMSIAKK